MYIPLKEGGAGLLHDVVHLQCTETHCCSLSLAGKNFHTSEVHLMDGRYSVNLMYMYSHFIVPKLNIIHFQNSIRHNLSLNPAFRKVEHSMRWQGKKGFFWEVTPERRASVEREVERYLRQEGKLREIDEIDGSEFVSFFFFK